MEIIPELLRPRPSRRPPSVRRGTLTIIDARSNSWAVRPQGVGHSGLLSGMAYRPFPNRARQASTLLPPFDSPPSPRCLRRFLVMMEMDGEQPAARASDSTLFTETPRKLVVALKPGAGLLLWPDLRDRASRQWVEVPSMPEVEAELREIFAHAINEVEGGEPRIAAAVGLPKVEFGGTCYVRVDIRSHGSYVTKRGKLSGKSCTAIWSICSERLAIAEISRALPDSFQLPTAFGFEEQLESYMEANWVSLPFSSRLDLVNSQYPTDVGRVDLLCRNRDGSGFTVIELKRGRTSDAVVGQVQRYKAWVREHLVRGDQSVWGIIVCQDPDPRLMAAVRETSNLELYTYTRSAGPVSFSRFERYRRTGPAETMRSKDL